MYRSGTSILLREENACGDFRGDRETQRVQATNNLVV